MTESTGGRPSTEYYFTIDASKEVCLVSETKKAKELRRWLISLSNKVDTAGLVTHSQVMEIVKMIKVFSIYEYRKQALSKNAENYNKSEEMINNICALARDLAKEMKPFLERLNQSNLFFQKIDTFEVKSILS